MASPVVEVAINLPVEGPFHYRVPPPLQGILERGHRVLAPFGRRRVTGFVVQTDVAPPEGVILKPLLELLDPEPLPDDLLRLARFAADYYVAPLGEVLRVALPPSLTGAVQVRLRITEAGKELLERSGIPGRASVSGDAAQVLAAMRRRPVAASKVPARIRSWLLQRGLCEAIDAKRAPTDEVAWVRRALAPKAAWPLIKRSAAKRALYERLEHGPLVQEQLRLDLSERRALKSMLEAGVLEAFLAAPAAIQMSATESGPELTAEQASAVEHLIAQRRSEVPKGALLEGVTGSGKTEVYLRVVREALDAGRGAIVLVPEIGLTPQVEAIFRGRFGDQVLTLHSALSDGERVRRWHHLRSGRARIALGPRSAVWAPVQDLGLIVVDEEHDGSYKQSGDLRYHGRDLALVRGQQNRALVVLASATPSLEARHLADEGRLSHLRLTQRPSGRQLPKVRIVDLIEARRQDKTLDLFSRPLQDALRQVLETGSQAILFLNRRGLHPFVSCGECGHLASCPRCDLTLTLHRGESLRCHTCGYSTRLDVPCTQCGMLDPVPFGAGTQRVVEALKEFLPQARVLRLDRDAATTARQVEATLRSFRRREADVLVGTKMVTKGHDFRGVTLVGILMADSSLAFPDFRAAEQTFQLLTQVAGRAGRGDAPGQVLVQTLQPEHPVLTCAVRHDVDAFMEIERHDRERSGYPPFGRLALVRCEGKDPDRVERVCRALAQRAQTVGGVRVLGPTESPVARIKERFRYRFMLRSDRPSTLHRALLAAARMEVEPGVDRIIDVDPHDFL